MHLVVAVGAVIDPDRLLSSASLGNQDDGIVGDFGSSGNEPDHHVNPAVEIEVDDIRGAHGRPKVGAGIA